MNSKHPQRFVKRIPEGDDRERSVCSACNFIDYQNPKIVSGALVIDDQSKILLCRRAIEPRRGYWTLPAGFLELGEAPEEGAIREVWEETRAKIKIDGFIGIFIIKHISQVQFFYHAAFAEEGFSAGPESLECAMFSVSDIPWEELAFSSITWALKQHISNGEQRMPLPPQGEYVAASSISSRNT